MDLYEQLVEVYLTVEEKCFVLPQVPVRLAETGHPVGLYESGAKWEAYPDFVALDFANKRVLVVEVTKSTDASGVERRIRERLVAKYSQKIDHWIRETLPTALGEFPIVRRLFLRQSVIEKLKGRISDVELIEIEHVFDTLRKRMP